MKRRDRSGTAMGSAYLEALIPACSAGESVLSEVRDPALLRETARLNRSVKHPPSEPPVVTPPSAATMIPPAPLEARVTPFSGQQHRRARGPARLELHVGARRFAKRELRADLDVQRSCRHRGEETTCGSEQLRTRPHVVSERRPGDEERPLRVEHLQIDGRPPADDCPNSTSMPRLASEDSDASNVSLPTES